MNFTSEQAIHSSRMRQEILFQFMVKQEIFKQIPVGELKKFVITAVAQIDNYSYHFEKEPRKKLFSDDKFNQTTFITNMLQNI